MGFPVEVNLSFLILLGFVLLFWGGLAGVSAVLILFASVLLHELGHALVARYLGVAVAGIEMHFFGGAAKMASQPKTANDEVLIAAAGPAVSFALGGLGFLLGGLTGVSFIQWIGWINVILGGFNLIPALPMDGGRILRALLTRKYTFERATEISVTITRGFAILLGVYGLATLQLFLPLLAVVLWFMATNELKVARFLGQQFSYNGGGYQYRGSPAYGEVEVLPRGFFDYEDWTREPSRRPRVVVRRRNGRLVIEMTR
ncbi:MAG: M50 family metallopeptidase [Proteobacteria bacterium]|nr:M50 family metallopeptidase [Pseudomonadota bacterium]